MGRTAHRHSTARLVPAVAANPCRRHGRPAARQHGKGEALRSRAGTAVARSGMENASPLAKSAAPARITNHLPRQRRATGDNPQPQVRPRALWRPGDKPVRLRLRERVNSEMQRGGPHQEAVAGHRGPHPRCAPAAGLIEQRRGAMSAAEDSSPLGMVHGAWDPPPPACASCRQSSPGPATTRPDRASAGWRPGDAADGAHHQSIPAASWRPGRARSRPHDGDGQRTGRAGPLPRVGGRGDGAPAKRGPPECPLGGRTTEGPASSRSVVKAGAMRRLDAETRHGPPEGRARRGRRRAEGHRAGRPTRPRQRSSLQE